MRHGLERQPVLQSGIRLGVSHVPFRRPGGRRHRRRRAGALRHDRPVGQQWRPRRDRVRGRSTLHRGVEFFAGYYNEIRPHQAHGRPPLAVYKERDKASPSIEGQVVSPTTKVRRDRVDTNGTVPAPHIH